MINKFKYFITLTSLYLVPSIAYGQIADSPEAVGNSLGNIATFMRNMLLILAALFIIIAAYKFLTAAGDTDKVQDAKRMLAYTVVAIIVAIISGGFAPLVENIIN